MKKKKRLDNAGGFTLIETIIALTIFSFIAIGVAASFFSGVKLWGRAANTDTGRNDILLNFESISGQLRQSIDMPLIGFGGDAASFSFPALSGDSIVRVSYAFDDAKKMLSRRELKLQDILNESVNDNAPEKDIVSLDEIDIRYLYKDPSSKDLEWREGWKKSDGIFIAVKFTFNARNEKFEKTVFIPIAQ